MYNVKRPMDLLGGLLLSLLVVSCASTTRPSRANAQTESTAVTLHLLGDSTMAAGTDANRPQYGWGEKFGAFFGGNVTIKNWAEAGCSSRSFYYETGRWDAAKAAIQAGDYVIIQFGLDDEKFGSTSSTGPYSTYGTYAISSDPAITDGENSTGGSDRVDPTTTLDEHSYYQFLKRYVAETRAKGGIPILMTPIVRRYLSNGTVTALGQHDLSATCMGTEANPRGNYPAAMKAVADKYSVPLVDLTAGSRTLVEGYGSAAAVTPYLFYPDDANLNGLFASLVAKLAVNGLQGDGLLTADISSVPSVLAGVSSAAFADTGVGSTSTQFFNLAGYDLTPASGTLTLTAPTGFKLSFDQSTWSSSLDLSYSSSAFTRTLYVQFVPTAAQGYSGSIGMVIGTTSMASVALSGTGVAVPSGTDSYALWPMMSSLLTGSATGLVSINDAVVSSGIPASSTTSGTFNGSTSTVNRYAATGITAADATRYIEFSIAPTSGTFTVTGISTYLGGSGGSGVYVDIGYSTDGFATSTTLAAKVNPPANTSSAGYAMTSETYAVTGLSVAYGKTLSVRLYPYYKDATSTNKFLSIANFMISGAVQ